MRVSAENLTICIFVFISSIPIRHLHISTYSFAFSCLLFPFQLYTKRRCLVTGTWSCLTVLAWSSSCTFAQSTCCACSSFHLPTTLFYRYPPFHTRSREVSGTAERWIVFSVTAFFSSLRQCIMCQPVKSNCKKKKRWLGLKTC
jgi:hypothetical protein